MHAVHQSTLFPVFLYSLVLRNREVLGQIIRVPMNNTCSSLGMGCCSTELIEGNRYSITGNTEQSISRATTLLYVHYRSLLFSAFMINKSHFSIKYILYLFFLNFRQILIHIIYNQFVPHSKHTTILDFNKAGNVLAM